VFRLLADPGDVVHLPEPGYPLFEHLAALEGLEVRRYRLRAPSEGARWHVDPDELAASLGPASRLVLVIHPHNPTGSFVAREDLARLRELCRERGLALLSDEVFADYAAAGSGPPGALSGADAGPLTFVLSGASKVLGLPQLKLAWIAAGGPAAARDEALARLEFVADAYLSVSPLLARALPRLLERREAVQAEIRARLAANRAQLSDALAGSGRAALLPAEAGWTALVALREGIDEEALSFELLERRGVRVQPGFLFDLEPVGGACGHLVLSLLPEPERFAKGAAALVEVLAG
jgi:aspartate/methionine/tyrosine aminotransferase